MATETQLDGWQAPRNAPRAPSRSEFNRVEVVLQWVQSKAVPYTDASPRITGIITGHTKRRDGAANLLCEQNTCGVLRSHHLAPQSRAGRLRSERRAMHVDSSQVRRGANPWAIHPTAMHRTANDARSASHAPAHQPAIRRSASHTLGTTQNLVSIGGAASNVEALMQCCEEKRFRRLKV